MPRHTIHGKVLHQQGPWGDDVGVANATIQIFDLDQGGNGDDLLWEGQTDEAGQFRGTTREWMDLNTMSVNTRLGTVTVPVSDRPEFRSRVQQGRNDTGQQTFQFPANGSTPIVIEVPWGPEFFPANPRRSKLGVALLDYIQEGGISGFLVRRIGVGTIVAHQPRLAFDPASSLKALVHAHAVREVSRGAARFEEMVPVPRGLRLPQPPGANCPFDEINTDPADILPLRLDAALMSMMQRSRNAPTEAVRTRFGAANITATGRELGLSNTVYDSAIGCDPSATGRTPNHTTAADLCQLYEQLATGFLTAAAWADFRRFADARLAWDIELLIRDITPQYTAGLNPPLPADFQQRYLARVVSVSKAGGSVDGGGAKSCEAGYLALPFCHLDEIVQHEYVYCAFLNNARSVTWNPNWQAGQYPLTMLVAEMLREEVAASIGSFVTFVPNEGWQPRRRCAAHL